MSSSIIPLEIEGKIIDLLAKDDKRYSAIKACSLVCQAFLPLCRKHIFASIVLNDIHSQSPTTRALERLLSTSPEIADYIRKLDYNISVDDFTSPSIQECLKRITKLQSLEIRHHNRQKIDWSGNHLRPALLHLLHLPTLTHFKITMIDKFSASDLIPCVNIKTLDIGRNTTGTATNIFPATFPDRSIQLNEFTSGIGCATAIMDICTAQRPDGQPVIDFSSLAKIRVAIEMDDDLEASEKLFERCKQLTDVSISLWPDGVRPSISNMLLPSMQTLRHLDIAIHINDNNVDPLANIPSQLKDMRNKNVIELIFISILVQKDASCRRGDDWGRLDEVLTSPGWPVLRQVQLYMRLGGSKELEVALRKLQFPRLSTSNSLKFHFMVLR